MTNDAEVSHRSALWLSMALTVLGSCGFFNGMNHYANTPIPSETVQSTDDSPGAVEASAIVITFFQAQMDAPNRRPLALVNVMCSLMLVAGGFMLGIRRASARWFITNALVANLALIVADTTINAMQLEGWRGVLVRRTIAWVHVVAPPAAHVTPQLEREAAQGYVTVLILAFVVGALIKAAIHAVVLYFAQHPRIQQFIDEAHED